jgi:Sec-independent protein secretion pathway component TatC
MFYLNELSFRAQYCSLSFIITGILFYIYKHLLLLILTFSILKVPSGHVIQSFDHFIYTHPGELLKIYFLIVICFIFIFILPYIVWHFLDFFRSSLFLSEIINLRLFLVYFFIFFFSFNTFSFFTLFPNMWFFFESFNNQIETDNVLNLFLELRIQDFLTFLFGFFYVLNFSILLFLALFFIIVTFGLKVLLSWKKLFIFVNISFATLLSPPDVFSQIVLFLFLTFLFEFILFFSLSLFKLKKYL